MSITLEHVKYIYSPGTAYEKQALRDVSLEIPQGQFAGIIGHTGSGKSTLIQHLNGLMKATSGKILYDGKNIYEEGYDMRILRSQVGLVFQYPEHQLFEVDVLSDVCFGPRNQGLPQEECERRAKEALDLVGFPEKYYRQSPFELSGGQKRRAVYLPAVMPYLLSACRVSVGMALKAGVAGEIIGLPRWSIGEQLYLSKLYLNTADLFAWSFVIIVLSVALEKLLVCFVSRMQRKWGDGR